jgi:hypothetical protein
MNKEIEVLNALESEYKVKLRWKTLEINEMLAKTENLCEGVDKLKSAISDYTENYSRLQMTQRIKDQILKGQENED